MAGDIRAATTGLINCLQPQAERYTEYLRKYGFSYDAEVLHGEWKRILTLSQEVLKDDAPVQDVLSLVAEAVEFYKGLLCSLEANITTLKMHADGRQRDA